MAIKFRLVLFLTLISLGTVFSLSQQSEESAEPDSAQDNEFVQHGDNDLKDDLLQ